MPSIICCTSGDSSPNSTPSSYASCVRFIRLSISRINFCKLAFLNPLNRPASIRLAVAACSNSCNTVITFIPCWSPKLLPRTYIVRSLDPGVYTNKPRAPLSWAGTGSPFSTTTNLTPITKLRMRWATKRWNKLPVLMMCAIACEPLVRLLNPLSALATFASEERSFLGMSLGSMSSSSICLARSRTTFGTVGSFATSLIYIAALATLSFPTGELYVSSADSKASSSTLSSRLSSAVPSSDVALAGRPRPVDVSALSSSAWYWATRAVSPLSFALAKLTAAIACFLFL